MKGLLGVAKFYAGFEKSIGNKVPYWGLVFAEVVRILYLEALDRTICRWKGHDWYDSGSYATPDSGADDLTCRRCGYSFHHIYY